MKKKYSCKFETVYRVFFHDSKIYLEYKKNVFKISQKIAMSIFAQKPNGRFFARLDKEIEERNIFLAHCNSKSFAQVASIYNVSRTTIFQKKKYLLYLQTLLE